MFPEFHIDASAPMRKPVMGQRDGTKLYIRRMLIELALLGGKARTPPKHPTIGTHLNDLWPIRTMSKGGL